MGKGKKKNGGNEASWYVTDCRGMPVTEHWAILEFGLHRDENGEVTEAVDYLVFTKKAEWLARVEELARDISRDATEFSAIHVKPASVSLKVEVKIEEAPSTSPEALGSP